MQVSVFLILVRTCFSSIAATIKGFWNLDCAYITSSLKMNDLYIQHARVNAPTTILELPLARTSITIIIGTRHNRFQSQARMCRALPDYHYSDNGDIRCDSAHQTACLEVVVD